MNKAQIDISISIPLPYKLLLFGIFICSFLYVSVDSYPIQNDLSVSNQDITLSSSFELNDLPDEDSKDTDNGSELLITELVEEMETFSQIGSFALFQKCEIISSVDLYEQILDYSCALGINIDRLKRAQATSPLSTEIHSSPPLRFLVNSVAINAP